MVEEEEEEQEEEENDTERQEEEDTDIAGQNEIEPEEVDNEFEGQEEEEKLETEEEEEEKEEEEEEEKSELKCERGTIREGCLVESKGPVEQRVRKPEGSVERVTIFMSLLSHSSSGYRLNFFTSVVQNLHNPSLSSTSFSNSETVIRSFESHRTLCSRWLTK